MQLSGLVSPLTSPHEATVDFSVDGDRSGGTVVETDDHVVFEDITMDQAQWYWAVAETMKRAAMSF